MMHYNSANQNNTSIKITFTSTLIVKANNTLVKLLTQKIMIKIKIISFCLKDS